MAADPHYLDMPSANRQRVVLFDARSTLTLTVTKAFAEDDIELRVHTLEEPFMGMVRSRGADLVLIEAETPKAAFAMCGTIRALELDHDPAIMLVTREAADEGVVSLGLLAGADDFVHLGDRLKEFHARALAQLRRSQRQRAAVIRSRSGEMRAVLERAESPPKVDVAIKEIAPLAPAASESASSSSPILGRTETEVLVEHAVETRAQFALLVASIDDFTALGLALGPAAAERAWHDVAVALAAPLRDTDSFGQWAANEFMAILPGTASGDAIAMAQRQRVAVESLRLGALKDLKVTVTLGIAMFDPALPDVSHAALCQRGLAGVAEARRSGPNRVGLAKSLLTRSRAGAPLPTPPHPQAKERTELESTLIRALQSPKAGLPVLPEAASEAMRLAQDPRTDLTRIARLVDRDPSLAARFVALASSAAYSRGAKSVSTQSAFVRIGLAAARDLLFQVVYEHTNEDLPAFGAQVRRSFERSVRCAVAARLVAGDLRMGYDSAYLCGLLHDIGESRVYRILSTNPIAIRMPDFVEELVARHHQRGGADITRAWHLPAEFAEVCSNHHATLVNAPIPVRIVMAADALVRAHDENEAALALPPSSSEPRIPAVASLPMLDLNERQSKDLQDRLKMMLEVAPPESAVLR